MVADGKDLSRYKAIIVPAAKYERRSVVEKLIKYVEEGGVLVFGHMDWFDSSPDGSSLAGQCAKLRTPRIVRDPVTVQAGKGKTLSFGDAFTEKNIGDEKFKADFKALVKDLGIRTDRDIWRFKFPEFKTVYRPDPAGRCLTGNYIKWRRERPLDILNALTGGVYKYSLAPDAVPDQGGTMRIGFDRGDLTDRKLAPTTKKADLRPDDFVASWKAEQPVSVTFDFLKPHPISRIRLWYSDQLPALTIRGSVDGRTWVDLAAHRKQAATQDVLDADFKAEGDFRYVRLSFGQHDPGQMMTLVECEVWAR